MKLASDDNNSAFAKSKTQRNQATEIITDVENYHKRKRHESNKVEEFTKTHKLKDRTHQVAVVGGPHSNNVFDRIVNEAKNQLEESGFITVSKKLKKQRKKAECDSLDEGGLTKSATTFHLTTSNNSSMDSDKTSQLTTKMKRKQKSKIKLKLSQTETPDIKCIQNWLLWLYNDMSHDRPRFGTWVEVNKSTRELIKSGKCLIVVVPYLDKSIIDKLSQRAMPFLYSHRESIIRTKPTHFKGTSRSCSILDSFLMRIPDDPDKEKNRKKMNNQREDGKFDNKIPVGLNSLLMNDEELLSNNFPLFCQDWREPFSEDHNNEVNHQFQLKFDLNEALKHPLDPSERLPLKLSFPDLNVETIKLLQSDAEFSNLIALDCEMADTITGKQVTRVSVIQPYFLDEEIYAKILLDELVLPTDKVVNYNEQFSGVTKEMLATVVTTIDDIRKSMNKIIKSTTIIVGHSLENDLTCLEIFHHRLIDTSIIYPHNCFYLKNSLKYLANKFLDRKIRLGVSHDSIEDAQIPLELVLLKSIHPSSFGGKRLFSTPKPLGNLLKTPQPSFFISDSLQHEKDILPLQKCLETFFMSDKSTSDEQNVVSYLKHFHNVKRGDGSLDKESEDSISTEVISKIHLCFLRDYQKLCHESIGGVQTPTTPRDIYNIGRRASGLVDEVLKKCKTVDVEQSDPAEVTDDWLNSALGTVSSYKPVLKTTSNINNDASLGLVATGVDDFAEVDPIGQEWIHKIISSTTKVPDIRILLPSRSDVQKRAILTHIDNHLRILFHSLNPGDLFIVMSTCGNPIPHLVVSRLIAKLMEDCCVAARDFFPDLLQLHHFNELSRTQMRDSFAAVFVK